MRIRPVSLYILFSFIFLCQNIAVPPFSDDLWIYDKFPHESLWQDICNWWQMSYDQWFSNGRAGSQSAMIWLSNIPDLWFDIISTLVVAGVIISLVFLSTNKRNRTLLLPWALAIFLLRYCTPDASSMVFWIAGFSNYWYSSLLCLSFLLILRYTRSKVIPTWIIVFSCWLAVIAGWSHEILSLPILGAMFMLMCANRFRASKQQWALMIAFGLGALMIVLSPGTLGRFMGTQTGVEVSFATQLQTKLVTSMKMFNVARSFYILVVAAVIMIILRKEYVKYLVKDNAFYLWGLLFSALITMILGMGGRAVWGVEFFSIIIMLRLLDTILDICQSSKVNIIGWVFAVVLLVHQAALVSPFFKTWNAYKEAVAQVEDKDKPTIRMEEYSPDNMLLNAFVPNTYKMMRQDDWMRIPLHNAVVCRADVYDTLKHITDEEYAQWIIPRKVGDDVLVPATEQTKSLLKQGKFEYCYKPISFESDGSLLYCAWHSLIQSILPTRYPTEMIVSPENVSYLTVSDKEYIRFEQAYHPVPREIDNVQIIRD